MNSLADYQQVRIRKIQLDVNNARFLIQVRVGGLASTALMLARVRLVADWKAVYDCQPLLAYTRSDSVHGGESDRWSVRKRSRGGGLGFGGKWRGTVVCKYRATATDPSGRGLRSGVRCVGSAQSPA